MQIVQKRGNIILTVSVKKTSISNDDSLQGIYKLSNRWVIVRPTVQVNKCAIKLNLI